MEVKTVLEIATAIIAGLGGGGAIVIGLSKFFGQYWADKMLEKEKSKHTKEIEDYKSKLKVEIDKINAIQDKALYISKVQYDNEYRIYQEIWEVMHKCIIFTTALYPQGIENVPSDEKEKEEYQTKKHREFANAFNTFSLTIDKYAPFYKEDFYNNFFEMRKYCSRMGSQFFHYEFDIKYNASFSAVRDQKMSTDEHREVYTTLHENIAQLRNKLRVEIRDYLLSLELK